MQIRGHEIGVCSWSLGPKDADDLVARVRQVGLNRVQLALGPLVAKGDAWREDVERLRAAGIGFTAGMIGFPGEDYSTIAMIKRTGGYVSDELFEERRAITLRAAEIAKEIGMTLLTTHIGFVPVSSDPGYATMVERVAQIAAPLAQHGIDLLMETGQESASELLQFMNDVRARNVGVNFDPANMILYGAGDPIDAIRVLGRHIRHVHVKDATESDQPGITWGNEVPFGTGEVGARQFLDALEDVRYTGPLVIEREAGPNRVADVRAAAEALRDAVE